MNIFDIDWRVHGELTQRPVELSSSQSQLRTKQSSVVIGRASSHDQHLNSPKALWLVSCETQNFRIVLSLLEIVQVANACNYLINIFFNFFSAAWGYHQQGYCQAGFSAVVSDVSSLRLRDILWNNKFRRAFVFPRKFFEKCRKRAIIYVQTFTDANTAYLKSPKPISRRADNKISAFFRTVST